MNVTRRFAAAVLLIGLQLVAFGQDKPNPAPAAGNTPPNAQAGANAAKQEEKKVENPLVDAVKAKKSPVRLGDVVEVTVKYDNVLREKVAAATSKKITLFVNGQDAEIEPIDKATATYKFRLERNEENQDLWQRILEAPFEEPKSDIHLSVGYDGKPLPAPGVGPLRFQKMDLLSVGAVIWLGILVIVLIYFFHLARTTAILRNGPADGGAPRAYSLGRCQMAWWLFIVIVSYVTIWMISGAQDTVSDSTLVLIGISGATALGSVAIDATSSTRVKAAIERLDTELTTLQTQRAAPAATPALIAAIDTRIAAINIEKANIFTSPPSVGWLTDVLTDDSGAVAIHRFQVLLWTFVLGVVFAASVMHVLSMPEFSNNLLALMGISAGTYLGFKIPTTG